MLRNKKIEPRELTHRLQIYDIFCLIALYNSTLFYFICG
jgi:hypothetical protein